MIQRPGWLVGLLMLALASFPSQAQTHGDICVSIGSHAVAVDICRANLRLWEEGYQRDLNAAASRSDEPQQIIQESADSLSGELARCRDSECIRLAYVNETHRLQSIEGRALNVEILAAPTEIDPSDHHARPSDASIPPSTSEDEVASWQQPEQIAANAPAAFDASPPGNEARQSDQPGANATPSGTDSSVPDPGETRETTFLDQLGVLALWGVLGCVLLVLLLAATNHVVVFYDGLDVWWSFAPILSLAIGYMIARSISSEDAGTSFLEILVLGIAVLIAVVSTLINYHNAILHNRSLLLGVIIGTLKIAAATFTAVSVAGQLSRLSDSESTRRQRADAMFVLAVIGFMWWVLVNGQRVYEKRGWQLEPAT